MTLTSMRLRWFGVITFIYRFMKVCPTVQKLNEVVRNTFIMEGESFVTIHRILREAILVRLQYLSKIFLTLRNPWYNSKLSRVFSGLRKSLMSPVVAIKTEAYRYTDTHSQTPWWSHKPTLLSLRRESR
jgi:hypothetical protein